MGPDVPIHQITLDILGPDQHTGEDTRAELARRLEADAGAPNADETGSSTSDAALQRVADTLADLGVDQH